MCEIESVWKCGYNIKREGSMLTGNFNTSQFIKHFRLVDFVRNTQADGWVSVQDRLPRVYQLVLLLTEDDNLYLSYFDTTKWIDSKGQDIDKKYKATHWMPLPEPPKSEVKDE